MRHEAAQQTRTPQLSCFLPAWKKPARLATAAVLRKPSAFPTVPAVPPLGIRSSVHCPDCDLMIDQTYYVFFVIFIFKKWQHTYNRSWTSSAKCHLSDLLQMNCKGGSSAKNQPKRLMCLFSVAPRWPSRTSWHLISGFHFRRVSLCLQQAAPSLFAGDGTAVSTNTRRNIFYVCSCTKPIHWLFALHKLAREMFFIASLQFCLFGFTQKKLTQTNCCWCANVVSLEWTNMWAVTNAHERKNPWLAHRRFVGWGLTYFFWIPGSRLIRSKKPVQVNSVGWTSTCCDPLKYDFILLKNNEKEARWKRVRSVEHHPKRP